MKAMTNLSTSGSHPAHSGEPNGVTKLPRQDVSSKKQYIMNLKHFILTSRFNNTTWQENCLYRKQYTKFGCIYCSPCQISAQVPVNATMFVLEMNNEENRIIGIGMVKNHPSLHALSVYSNYNYNRYQYFGKHRIDRSDMTDQEETIMRVFDILCFTGNSHQKRGHGLTLFPLDHLYRCSRVLDLVEFICYMFRSRLPPIPPTKKIAITES